MPLDQKSSRQSGSPFEMVTTSKSKKLSAKNILIIVVALIFLSVSVFLGVYLVGKRTNIAEKASPATAIYITPGSQTKSPGTNFSFSVNMDTSTNAVTGVDVRLIFNPAVMQVLSIQQGSGIANLNQTITNTYDNTSGTVSFAVFTLDSSKAITGSGINVLTVNATVKSGAATGSSNITFDPATAASASQEGQNVLISKSQGVLVVSTTSGSTSPTATATATSRATATATATSRATATATATSRATATATATSRATATATATSRATATATATAIDNGNSCGGSCGSNSNCQSNYMCYQGYCRNPNCPSETSCGCSGTTATATSQATARPIPVTGTNWPTVMGAMVGLFTIIAAILVAI